ncbi:MAG: transcriptional regulator [Ornithinimicrobium sp.]
MFFSEPAPAVGYGNAESRTRDQVHRAIGARGPVTARAVAEELDLTPAAVRRHFDALIADEAIVEREVWTAARRRRGRPARAYVLTDRGQAQLDNSYEDIATAALTYLAERAGDGAVHDFAGDQMATLASRIRPQVDQGGDDLTARTEALATALSEEGFAASVRPVAEGTGLAGLQLCQGHCPVQHIATSFPALCDAETDVISDLLGVHVQRLATLAGGAHVCTTFVPTGGQAASQTAVSTASRTPDTRRPDTRNTSTTDERLSR